LLLLLFCTFFLSFVFLFFSFLLSLLRFPSFLFISLCYRDG
jgi:hypothetical protein